MGSSGQHREIVKAMVASFGKAHQARIETGVSQVLERWRREDGSSPVLREFCLTHFVCEPPQLQNLLERFEKNLSVVMGNYHRIYRTLNWPLHVDAGPMSPVDHLFANFDVYAHLEDDLYQTRLAFVLLLNFPLAELEEKEGAGATWERLKWAQTRLVERIADRVPAAVKQQRTAAYTAVEDYIYHYNIHMDALRDSQGNSCFPEGKVLISHWGLRDEIKAAYVEDGGLGRQEMIYKIMERIISQEIPGDVIGNGHLHWYPESNRVVDPRNGEEIVVGAGRNRRYEALRSVFLAEKKLDDYMPALPTLIDRRFRQDREILENDVEELLKTVLSAPVLKDVAELIRTRLGRPLQPFDIWYSEFRDGEGIAESELDRRVQAAYPNLAAFKEKMGDLLITLGFTPEKAAYLQSMIEVDPARGAGHAMGGGMPQDAAHLRTRVPAGGMDYKGFNTAMHELGHTVEQVFSMNEIDYFSLNGVPNTAFTEAFAFIFQDRDLEVLGLKEQGGSEDWRTLHGIWQTMEIAGVALLDMKIWRWMYRHPDADARVLKEAVVKMANTIWNTYFAPVLGVRDSAVLAIYSHLIFCGMYTPDYALGHIIAFQIESFLQNRSLAVEMERMCRLGRIAPQVWMKAAVGEALSAQPLIDAASHALENLRMPAGGE